MSVTLADLVNDSTVVRYFTAIDAARLCLETEEGR